jgi:hypothetical protein
LTKIEIHSTNNSVSLAPVNFGPFCLVSQALSQARSRVPTWFAFILLRLLGPACLESVPPTPHPLSSVSIPAPASHLLRCLGPLWSVRATSVSAPSSRGEARLENRPPKARSPGLARQSCKKLHSAVCAIKWLNPSFQCNIRFPRATVPRFASVRAACLGLGRAYLEPVHLGPLCLPRFRSSVLPSIQSTPVQPRPPLNTDNFDDLRAGGRPDGRPTR